MQWRARRDSNRPTPALEGLTALAFPRAASRSWLAYSPGGSLAASARLHPMKGSEQSIRRTSHANVHGAGVLYEYGVGQARPAAREQDGGAQARDGAARGQDPRLVLHLRGL